MCQQINTTDVATQFYPLTIDFLEHETDDSVVIGFDTSSAPADKFKFIAGQNINIRFFKDGEEYRRTYSICTAPYEDKLRIGVRSVPNGIFSNMALHHLKPGDVLEVMPPGGSFTIANNRSTSDQYIFFAVGSGITPVISMIKYILDNDGFATCKLFYGNKNIASMMFRNELDQLKNKFMSRLQIVYTFTREQTDNELFYGRLTNDKCSKLIDSFVTYPIDAQYFLCGPEDMTLSVKELLVSQLNIPSMQVHFELFYVGLLPVTTKAPTEVQNGMAQVTLRLYNKEVTFDLDYNGESILDAGIRNGLDLPYACKGGVCSTCKGHMTTGEVQMDANFALEDDELEDGYILTCQSHPRASKIYVNYDY